MYCRHMGASVSSCDLFVVLGHPHPGPKPAAARQPLYPPRRWLHVCARLVPLGVRPSPRRTPSIDQDQAACILQPKEDVDLSVARRVEPYTRSGLEENEGLLQSEGR